jgi:hypothetical protein
MQHYSSGERRVEEQKLKPFSLLLFSMKSGEEIRNEITLHRLKRNPYTNKILSRRKWPTAMGYANFIMYYIVAAMMELSALSAVDSHDSLERWWWWRIKELLKSLRHSVFDKLSKRKIIQISPDLNPE